MSAAEAARLTARTSADLSAHGFLHTPLKSKRTTPGSPGAKAARPLQPRGTGAAPGRGKRTAPKASAVEEITAGGEAASKQPAARAGAGRLATEGNKSGAGTTVRGRGAGRRGRGRGRTGVQAGLAGRAQALGAASERQLTAETGEAAQLVSLQPASPAAEDDDELGNALWADLKEDSPSDSATVEAAGCPEAARPGAAAPAPAGGGPGPAVRVAEEAAAMTAGSRAASVPLESAHKTTVSRQNSTQALKLPPGTWRVTKLPASKQGGSPAAQPSQETWLTAAPDEEPISPAEMRRWEEEVSSRKYKNERLHQVSSAACSPPVLRVLLVRKSPTSPSTPTMTAALPFLQFSSPHCLHL